MIDDALKLIQEHEQYKEKIEELVGAGIGGAAAFAYTLYYITKQKRQFNSIFLSSSDEAKTIINLANEHLVDSPNDTKLTKLIAKFNSVLKSYSLNKTNENRKKAVSAMISISELLLSNNVSSSKVSKSDIRKAIALFKREL